VLLFTLFAVVASNLISDSWIQIRSISLSNVSSEVETLWEEFENGTESNSTNTTETTIEKTARIIVGVGFLVIGPALNTVGFRFFAPLLFFGGFFTTSGITYFLLELIPLSAKTPAGVWLTIILACVFGIIAGIIMIKLLRVGIFFCVFLCVATAVLLITALGGGWLSIFWARLGVVLLFGIVGGLVAAIFEGLRKVMLIVGTAFLGAYLFWAAWDLFFHYWCGYGLLFKMLFDTSFDIGDYVRPVPFYIFFALTIICAVGGGIIQYLFTRDYDPDAIHVADDHQPMMT